MKNIKHKLKNIQNDALKSLYESSNIFLAQRQQKNLLRHLFRASISGNKVSNGIFKCNSKRCKVCQQYLQECNKFTLSNNMVWKVPNHITCHSINAIYF